MALFSKEPEKGLKVQPFGSGNTQSRTRVSRSEPTASLSEHEPDTTPATEEIASLGRDSKVAGRIDFAGSAQVNGEIEGEIVVTHTLHIGESATITAEIRGEAIVVAGKVRGNITGSHKIELRPSAVVIGDLSAPTMIVQEGARVEGHCSMPGAVRKDERVNLFPKQEGAAHSTLADGPEPAPATNSKMKVTPRS